MTEIQTLIAELGALSYLGIFGMAFLANVVVPIPEEIIIIAFGYVMSVGRLSVFLIVPLIIAGLFASDAVMYFLSRSGSKLLKSFYNKFFGSWIGQREEWLTAHLKQVVFTSRFMIQLRFLGPFLAGQKKMHFGKFALYDLAAIIVYVAFYSFIGWYFHSRIEVISSGIHIARNIILLVVVAGALFWLMRALRNFFLKPRNGR